MSEPIILLIDDDEDFLTVARRALRRAGIRAEVRVARDGGEGLRALGLHDGVAGSRGEGFENDESESTESCRPAVVLLDLSMPVRNGWDVLHRIRKASVTREIPVVIVSSSDRPDDVRRSYELGANSFVVKRYDAQNPGGYLAEAARYWLDLNEPPPVAREQEVN